MHMNVFSVKVRIEDFDGVATTYGDTMATLASSVEGFKGMMGLVNRDAGHVMSISLIDKEPRLHDARTSDVNQNEIARYQHVFLCEPKRESFRVDARYMPMNRPFPGESAFYARVTTGRVLPRDVVRTIDRNRDSLIFAAIYEPGCCGYFLCSNRQKGVIFGMSLWDTEENLLRSESDRGYYHREMARNKDVLLGPYEYQSYEVFARLMPG